MVCRKELKGYIMKALLAGMQDGVHEWTEGVHGGTVMGLHDGVQEGTEGVHEITASGAA